MVRYSSLINNVDTLVITGFSTSGCVRATALDALQHGYAPFVVRPTALGATSLAGSATPVSTANNGDLPPASGDAKNGASMGAIILDGYNRAFVLNLAKTLRQAEVDKPLARALQGDVKVGGASAGPLSVAMTVSQRHDLASGFELDRIGIGPDDARKARLIAGSAVARLDNKTAVAFGFADTMT